MNIKDIDSAILALNDVIKDHYEWSGHLLGLGLMDGIVDYSIISPCSHRHCAFSRWLREAMKTTNDNEAQLISIIEQKHLIMHTCASELMSALINKTATQQLVNDFLSARTAFSLGLDKYKDYLYSFRNMHDTLTGLPLRDLLYQHFDTFCSRARCRQRDVYILLMDIDHFKHINDTWGHNAGDDVLRAVAQTLIQGSRLAEPVYRFGGEEFIMLLEAESDDTAGAAGARHCQYLEAHPVNIQGNNVTITATAGVAKRRAGEFLHDLIGRADTAMYYGKNSGRNRCILVSDNGEMQHVSVGDYPLRRAE